MHFDFFIILPAGNVICLFDFCTILQIGHVMRFDLCIVLPGRHLMRFKFLSYFQEVIWCIFNSHRIYRRTSLECWLVIILTEGHVMRFGLLYHPSRRTCDEFWLLIRLPGEHVTHCDLCVTLSACDAFCRLYHTSMDTFHALWSVFYYFNQNLKVLWWYT